ncbi:MAG: thiol:disulfide interchange protein DsbA/DsbL [Pseudomonas sp.]
MKPLHRLLLILLALAPLAAFAAEQHAPIAGEDYIEITDGQPYLPLDGKIEVAEVFGYPCPHCAHFEPKLEQWAARQPKYVRLTPVPAAFGGPWDAFARAYLAADALGVASKSHLAMFQAIHDKHSMPVQNVAPEELAAFYADYGVAPQVFIDTLKSAQVDARLKAAREFALRSGVRGTPSIIVNGRYLARGKDFDDVLRVTDWLVARERAATARAGH